MGMTPDLLLLMLCPPKSLMAPWLRSTLGMTMKLDTLSVLLNFVTLLQLSSFPILNQLISTSKQIVLYWEWMNVVTTCDLLIMVFIGGCSLLPKSNIYFDDKISKIYTF